MSTEVVLDRSAASVPAARAHVRQALRAWGQAAQTVDDAALLVTELVDNAVRHTTGARIAVHLTHHDDRVRCLVLDADPTPPRPAFRDPSTAVGEPHSATTSPDLESVLPESGRGLRLVDAVADRWGSHPDTRTGWSRKAVWFECVAHGPHHADTLAEPNLAPHTPSLPVRPQRPALCRAVPLEDDPATLRRVLDGLHRLP